ncbi:alpha-L RNA-binding motif-containing protein [Meredithblackwellia eburnea MCA 4105]
MGHKVATPNNIAKCLPRMSWSPKALYNLHQRTYGPQASSTKFLKSSLTLFQQKWKAKQLARAYHGDWIEEGKFKKTFLPHMLPQLAPKVGSGSVAAEWEDKKVPLASMMFAEVEKRIDTVVFRACLAHSAYRARQMVIHGSVKLNGQIHRDPNTKLQPGDLITVAPEAISTLQKPKLNTPSSSETEADSASEAVSESSDSSSEPPASTTTTTSPTSSSRDPLPFQLPEFASPFLFIPPYLEPSFQTCSVVYLRHPTAGPGYSEIPSPYEADGEVMRLTWEYYSGLGRKETARSKNMIGARLGS